MTDYEASFELLMPGNTKKTQYTIVVKDSPGIEDALTRAKAEWMRLTAPRDVRIRELPKSLTSPV